MRSRYIIYFLLLVAACHAQQAELKRERVFTGPGLYGFMNGGADQFLEYGVRKLTAREIVFEEEEYSIEIYEMPSPEEAFGIYSLHTFRCRRADASGCIDCLSPYQLQAVAGNTYVSVVFPSGSDHAAANADKVLRMYASPDTDGLPAFPAVLKTAPPYSGRLKYFRGPLSVSTADASFSRLMEDISYKGIWYEPEGRPKSYRALIWPANAEEAGKLKQKIPSAGILEETADYIYITGSGKEESGKDPGPFGF
jgi:hypothetical protein